MIVKGNQLEPIDFGGLRIRDYTAGMGRDCSIAFIDVPPGGSHAEAWSRRSDKHYLVVEGNIRFVLDGVPVELSAGDFCLVRQGQRFSYTNVQPHGAAMVLVHTPAFRLEDDVFPDSI